MSNATTGSRMVPLVPLQERFHELQARGTTAADIAYWLGWVQSAGHKCAGKPDASRFLRAIGLRPEQDGAGVRRTRTQATEESFLRLAEAMGLDPWEVGL